MDWSFKFSSTLEIGLFYAFLAILAYFVIRRISFLRRLPPGPWGLPLIGQLAYLNRVNALKEIQKWKEIYGKFFSFSVGDFYVIVLNDYKIILDTLKRDEFSGRPDFQSWSVRNQGKKNRGILFTDGVDSWHEQRRFVLRTLRDFGFGKESMEGLLQYELELLIERFKKEIKDGKPIEMRNALNASVFNSVWYIVTGKRFELGDPTFLKLLAMVQGTLQATTLTTPRSFYPWPVKYNLVRRGLWSQMTKMYQGVLGLIDKVVQEHVDTYDENQTRDYIDTYLHFANNHKSDPVSSFNEKEARVSLKIVILDLFSAGIETSSTTLLWAILYLTKYPEIQKKLQNEIDTKIGKDRPPRREDKTDLIYMDAFTNEVHRKASIFPMDVYHKMQSDVEFEGYLFPKGAIVFPNLYNVHHDKEYWGDPENFRPERFLDHSGTQLIKYDALMPFSTGKRVCLGETLARDTLFIFLAGLLQTFTFELDPLSQFLDLNQMKPMFVVSPDPFKVILKLRK